MDANTIQTMNETSILVIEDDAAINDVINRQLRKCGYSSTAAFSGTEALLLLSKDPFDLIITDLMLPGASGESLVQSIRKTDADIPIIVVSAKTDSADKVDLLRMGADDYLGKPFDLDELTARVEVQLRRKAKRSCEDEHADMLRFRDWSIDRDARTLFANSNEVPLTRTEFDMLELMAAHPSRVFSKKELYEHVWDEPYVDHESSVAAHISNIRSKLKESGTDSYIQTVWGIGFKLS